VKALLPLLFGLLLVGMSCSRQEPNATSEAPPAGLTGLPAARLNNPADWVSLRHVEIITALIDPVKLDTLKGDRAANGRLRKVCYWLKDAEKSGSEPGATLEDAQQRAGYGGTPRAAADRQSILRNLAILERLGCLTEDGMDKLRKGNAPTITRGPYAGDIASVNHIIPRSVAPELDEKLYNLEFMPSKLNTRKSNGVGQRQRALAKEWAGKRLLSREVAERLLEAGTGTSGRNVSADRFWCFFTGLGAMSIYQSSEKERNLIWMGELLVCG